MGQVTIGIDPGKSGGIAFLKDGELVAANPMPLGADGKVDAKALYRMISRYNPSLCVLEKVHSMPNQGVKSMFTFGEGYGMVQAVLSIAEIPICYVTPQAWKAQVLKGYDYHGNKLAAVAFVNHRFPKFDATPAGCRVAHLGVVDAVCIALYKP
jgi:crossover junction endodeoxyribonuclease RuvC